MSSKVEFLEEVEDARTPPPFSPGILGQENRLQVAHLLGNASHLLPAELRGGGVEKHRQAITAVGLATEDVNV